MRVLTWNVRQLRDDAWAVARALRALDPDVVCLQEAPRLLRWRAKLAQLARNSGLRPACGGRSAGDCALLVHPRVDVVDARDLLLPKTRGLHRRGVALAVVRREAAALAVASVHLGLDESERRRHVEALIEILGSVSAPVVVGADLNEVPDGPSWQLLGRRLSDCAVVAPDAPASTYPARRPRVRIDALFADPRVEVLECGVPPPPAGVPPYDVATDHLPVLARLRVGSDPAR
ncbi:MAG: endonuclease/exonuclease/phosphatase family protein [Actinomycetota bacterium]|nr:endonuclease/exonuclease/phosphatase family protein [Actinomycetota bacterium]